MGNKNKGSFLISIIIMFVLFLSMISVIFETNGNFFSFEFFLLLVFMIASLALMYDIANCKVGAWPGMIIFYSLNLINQLIVYFNMGDFTDIILPMMASGLGFLIALIKLEPEGKIELESY